MYNNNNDFLSNDFAMEREREYIPVKREKSIDEIIGSVNDALSELGDKLSPKEDQYVDKEMQDEIEATRKEELGNFFFILRENQLGNLSPATAARLIYLCTFLTYDGWLKYRRKYIKKSDLGSMLNISPMTVNKFWDEVGGKYLTKDKYGLKVLNRKDYPEIKKGAIPTKNNYAYEKIYIDCVRKLYEDTPATRHRHLGYVFQLIPYINTEYNVICANPNERDLDAVEFFTVSDFCKKVHYKEKDFSKLMDIYKKVTFKVNGREERFLTRVDADGEMMFFVNPHIVYAGSNYYKVEILGRFSKC